MERKGYKSFLVIFLALGNWSESKMKQPVVRISTGEIQVISKYVELDSNGLPTKVDGLGFDYVDWLSKRTKTTPVVVKAHKNSGSLNVLGTLKNGTWDGIMGDLTRNEADWGVVTAGQLSAYNTYASLTFPFMVSQFAMFIPFPELQQNVWSFTKPFEWKIWLLTAVSLLCTGTVLWYRSNNTCSRSIRNLGTTFLYLISVLTGQGGNWNYKARGAIIIGTTWCLASLVLVYAYSGVLISNLTTATPKPLVSSLEDLASMPEVQFYVYNGSYYGVLLTSAPAGPEKILGEQLRQNPGRFLGTPDTCMKQVTNRPCVCFATTGVGDNYVKQTFKSSGKCIVARIGSGVAGYHPSFLTQKNSAFFNGISEGIIWARALGLDQRWHMKYKIPGDQCNLNKNSKSNTLRKISLKDISGAFVILGIGFALSLILFVAEIIRGKHKK